MSTYITAGGVTVVLPDGHYWWSDELSWQRVAMVVETSVTGRPLISVGRRSDAGRPLTLTAVDAQVGLLTRSDLLQIRAWLDEPEQEMRLGYGGIERQVIWRHHEPPAVELDRPVWPGEHGEPGDLFFVRALKFLIL